MMPLLRSPAENASPKKPIEINSNHVSRRAIARQTRRLILKRCFATGAPPVLMVEGRTYGHTGSVGDGFVTHLSGRSHQVFPWAARCGQNLRSLYQARLSKFDR